MATGTAHGLSVHLHHVPGHLCDEDVRGTFCAVGVLGTGPHVLFGSGDGVLGPALAFPDEGRAFDNQVVIEFEV